jgi:hypothetical protein
MYPTPLFHLSSRALILQNDMDKVLEINYNGKRQVKSLRPFTQLNEQTLKY